MNSAKWLKYEKEEENEIRTSLSNLVKEEVERNEYKRYRLQTIYLFLTRKCNLACQHCYIKDVGKGHEKDFTFDSIKEIIDSVVPLGIKKIKVTGGEPFIRKDILKILKYLNDLGIDIVLETNGTLFTPETVKELTLIHNLEVFVSLDHYIEQFNDEFRGKAGSFKKTIETLRQLGSTEIKTTVTTVASKTNYRNIVDLINLVIGLGIKRHRTLLNIHPIGNAVANPNNAITLEESEELIASLLDSQFYRSGKSYMSLPPALYPIGDLQGIYSCGWGNNVIGILSNGDVSMCSASYDDASMIGGNLREKDLLSIWDNSMLFNKLRDIRNGNVNGVCGNCIFFAACGGVCRMSSYSHYGKLDAPYPLCQSFYNNGIFPRYALKDPEKLCFYGGEVIKTSRFPLHD